MIGELFAISRRNDELEKEVDRLKRIIARELTEDDALGSEYTYVVAMKEEVASLREQLKVAEEHLTVIKDSGCLWKGQLFDGCPGCKAQMGLDTIFKLKSP